MDHEGNKNPYPDQRFSSCPDCGKLTKWRKFVLLVHIDAFFELMWLSA